MMCISETLWTLCPYEVQKLEYVTQRSSTEKIFRLQRLPVLSFCVVTKRAQLLHDGQVKRPQLMKLTIGNAFIFRLVQGLAYWYILGSSCGTICHCKNGQ